MRFLLSILLISSLTLAACGGFRDSRLNPVNWFGKSRSQAIEQPSGASGTKEVNPLIGDRKRSPLVKAKNTSVIQRSGLFRRDKVVPYEGTPVDQVTDLQIERTSTGAIVRATGLTLRQGAFDVRLLRDNDEVSEDGVLTYTLRALQPVSMPQGPQRTRTIRAADYISKDDLSRVRVIRVSGARNVRTTSR